MLLLILCAMVWLALGLRHGRFWQSGPTLPAAVPPAVQDKALAVAIIVPARDEAASITPVLQSLVAQDYPGPFEVVLVDDNSSDGTGDLARAIPGVRVISGAERPAGWAGKLWAVHQGVGATTEPLVLHTDADIIHDPGHLSSLVAGLMAMRVEMVSEMVALRCVDLPERALVPAFVYFFQLLYPFARVNDPTSACAAAAGGTVLIRRRALERIGGIAAIKGALIDDVALATKVKQGGRIWLGHSAQARSIRPYRQWRDIWSMVARSAYVQLGYSPLLLVGSVLGMALVFLLPVVAALSGSLLGVLLWLAMAASFVPTLRRFRLNLAWGLALPAIACFYMAATVGSAVSHHRGHGVRWKNRAYTETSQ